MHIGFLIQNEAMIPHGELLMRSLARTSYESVRIMVPEGEMELVQLLRENYPQKTVLVQPFSMPEAHRKFPFADKLSQQQRQRNPHWMVRSCGWIQKALCLAI